MPFITLILAFFLLSSCAENSYRQPTYIISHDEVGEEVEQEVR